MLHETLQPVVDLVRDRRRSLDRTLIVGLAGGVAVGKSTFSNAVGTELDREGFLTEVVSTDGFLMSNEQLRRSAMSDRKGFPDSYDIDAIAIFLADVRDGRPTSVPIYDHQLYDVTDATRAVSGADVVIFEGVNALHFSQQLDLSIYLDADVVVMENWYLDRALGFREAARTTYSPFFSAWTDVPDDQFVMMARTVWAEVNLPNLTDNILPTRDTADIVVKKADDHSIHSIEIRGAT